jgi:hypothetical protein
MKSILMIIAVALASGLLVASGAMAGEQGWVTGQQKGSRHEVDIMAPGLYTTWDLDSAISAGQAGAQEMAPAGAFRREADVFEPGYNTWDLGSAISAGQAGGEEMAPATSSRPQVDIMEPSTQPY